MSQCPQFNLFDYSVMSNKRSEYMVLTSNSKFGQLLYLKKEFFQECISSSITPSSRLHELFCSNCSPLVINLARENSSSTSVSTETINNVHSFLSTMTEQYQPSSTIYRVLASCTFSLFTFHRLSSDNNYETLGWIAYICDPLVGLLILFVIVKDEYRNKGVGTAMIQTLQLFSHNNVGTTKTLVWFTKVASSASNDLVKYYRNLGFHITIPINHVINHLLPSTLVSDLNEVSGNAYNEEKEFLLEVRSNIQKSQMEMVYESSALSSDPTTSCENCGTMLGKKKSDQRNFVLCHHVLKGSMRVQKSGTKNKSICGMILCYKCQSYFGCDQIDLCPLHHRTKPSNIQQHNIWLDTIKGYKICSIALSNNINNTEKFQKKPTMSYCKHCCLLKEVKYTKNPNYVYFNTMQLSSPKFLRFVYNNEYDIRHLQWMINNDLHKDQICPFSGNMRLKHPTVFRSNSGKPSSILLNALFSIRLTEGHGDCGVLCLLYSFSSVNNNINSEIQKSCKDYIHNHWLTKHISCNSVDISTIKGIRRMILYAKIDNSDDNMPCLARVINASSYALIDDTETKKGQAKKKKKTQETICFMTNCKMLMIN